MKVEMKDSRIPWIGSIPSTWKVIQLSSIFKEHKEKNKLLDENNLLSLSYGRIIRKDINTKEGLLPRSFDGYNIIQEGDIVFRLTDLQNDKRSLRTGLCKEKGIITSAYITIRRTQELNSEFFYYLLHSYDECKVFYGLGDGVRQGMTFKDLRKLLLVVPPFQLQQKIANFLDEKCADIDQLITLQQQMIDELKAYKQSVITEAVCKGLDKSVPMKDSGIEWIGEVPEGWDIVRLRFLCQIDTGNKDTINKEEDGAYPFYVRSPKIERINTYSYDGEAVLMSGDGAGAGRIFHYVNGKFDYHQRVYNIHKISKVIPKLLYYYLSINFFKKIEEGNAKSTVDSVRLPMILNFPVVFGNIHEQEAILNYLNNKTSQIDSLISIKQQKIDELKEYKKSMIYEYITGKKEVPNQP